MSIATRPTGGDPASGSWNGSAHKIGISRPPEELLPDGGNLAPAPAPAPDRVLARDALHLIRLIRATGPAALPWSAGDLSRDVDAVRRQLDPIRSRRSLAASYRREAFHELASKASGASAARTAAAAARIAYAIRWLELGPDRA